MNRLKTLRISKKLSQNQIAKILNVTRTAYSMYETGKRTPNSQMLCILADFYGVNLDYLLERTNISTPCPTISADELKLLHFYRIADTNGKETIYKISELEAKRMILTNKK